MLAKITVRLWKERGLSAARGLSCVNNYLYVVWLESKFALMKETEYSEDADAVPEIRVFMEFSR